MYDRIMQALQEIANEARLGATGNAPTFSLRLIAETAERLMAELRHANGEDD